MASTPEKPARSKDHSDDWKPECVAKHLGPWLIQPDWFKQAVSAVKAGIWQPKGPPATWAEIIRAGGETRLDARTQGGPPEPLYFVDGAGLAIIPIDGPMMKGESKYGGANTLKIRRQVRTAARDPDVRGIFFAIDSPGGTVAGTQELAADVADAGTLKPTFAHIDDLGASAAYWVASQTGRITASATSEVGSIGVVAVVEDTSGQMEKKGIKVHTISTGAYKGAGVEGTPITNEQLGYMQERVNAIHAHFLEAVAQGRGQPMDAVHKWANGKVWIAETAREMGLIDEVTRMDDALSSARAMFSQEDRGTPYGTTTAAQQSAKIWVEAPVAQEDAQTQEDRRKRILDGIARRERAEAELQERIARRLGDR